jgi:alpha-tubulin suppressor-like RCC1 family protein
MPRIFTTAIPDSECMGDSLVTINTNYDNLDNAVQALSSQTISITDTSTIDLTYNSNTRNLTASVKLSSITPEYLSNTFTLSASQITNKPEAFKRFRENLGDKCHSTHYRSSFYLSNDNTLYAAGYSGGTHSRFGMGENSTQTLYSGWNALSIPLLLGEKVEKFWTAGQSNPSLYILTNVGNLYATGYNGYGQLGLGDVNTRRTWVKISLSNVVYFDACTAADDIVHCFAINSSGELYAWGYNGYGGLGLGNTTQQNSPQRVNVGAIAGKTIKKAFAFGDTNFSYAIDSADLVYSCGYNGQGQLGQNNTTNTNTFQPILNQATLPADYIIGNGGSGVGLGATGSAFLIRNNEIWSTGYNGYGQLGLGNTTQRTSFAKITGISAKQVTLFRNAAANVAVLQLDGTLRVWGRNEDGCLGVGDSTQRNSPTTPTGNPTNVIKIQGHGYNAPFLCYLNSAGDLYTTGYNGYGHLGLGDSVARNTFQKVIKNGNAKFVDFDLFGSNTGYALVAVDEEGNLWSCGYNGQSMVAIADTPNNYVEVLRKTVLASHP